MTATDTGLFNRDAHADWIRLRTLIFLRWIAIAGQIIAIGVGQLVFDLNMPLGFCYLAVGASVVANLIAMFVFPENKRLGERELALMILFDIAQLSFLIFLTGGLNNPFALLVLAPVTISATVLGLRSTVVLGLVALILTSVVAIFYVPLRTDDGFLLQMPQIFVFGFWAAITIGIVFISGYANRVSTEMLAMSEALLATQMALAREQKLTDLGGVVAAAAHELGTPLATIKLVSAELMDELEDRPEQRQDAQLIREQADRCREILRSMGRAGKEDLHLQMTPLETVLREAAEPHSDRGVKIIYNLGPQPGSDQRQPVIRRKPEIIHGLRNLVQNAVDFARECVWVDAHWSNDEIVLRITDDGPGFPLQVIGRIGDPFVRRRRSRAQRKARPEYEGMGLGLFIAKTLLERTSAKLSFSNGSDPYDRPTLPGEPRGAVVEVRWDRAILEPEKNAGAGALGLNQKIEI